jgi:hypothetical protein
MESWSIAEVSDWISSLGFPSESLSFKEHKIDGQVLVLASHEMLKELSIEYSERNLILNAIYKARKLSGIDDFEVSLLL